MVPVSIIQFIISDKSNDSFVFMPLTIIDHQPFVLYEYNHVPSQSRTMGGKLRQPPLIRHLN